MSEFEREIPIPMKEKVRLSELKVDGNNPEYSVKAVKNA